MSNPFTLKSWSPYLVGAGIGVLRAYPNNPIHRYVMRAKAMEFPTKSGYEVKDYSDCSYSAGETYPSEE